MCEPKKSLSAYLALDSYVEKELRVRGRAKHPLDITRRAVGPGIRCQLSQRGLGQQHPLLKNVNTLSGVLEYVGWQKLQEETGMGDVIRVEVTVDV